MDVQADHASGLVGRHGHRLIASLRSIGAARALLVLRVIAAAAALGWVSRLVSHNFWDVVVKHDAPTAMRASGVWGALLLVSFTGWGSLVGTAMFPRERADLGLRCAWGWGVTVAIGGAMCGLGIARAHMLIDFAAAGLVLFALDLAFALFRWAARPHPRRARLLVARLPYSFAAAFLFVLGVVEAGASILDSGFNFNDDNVAYFEFAREILERGTLTQPFSLRRISAYGGKDLLDAIELAIDVPETHVHLVDAGMGLLTVLLLLAFHPRTSRASSRVVVLVAMLFFVSLPAGRFNSGTSIIGVLFFLALYRTLAWRPVARAGGWRPAVLVAMLAAGACTLRQNYLVTIGAVLAIAYGAPIVRALRTRPPFVDRAAMRDAVRDAVLTASLLVLFLFAWGALEFRWTRTFLFPIVNGNYNKAYTFFAHLKPFEWLHYVWKNVCVEEPIQALPLFLLAAFALRDARPRVPNLAIAAGALLGFAGLVYGYPRALPPNQARYYYGFACAAVLAVALASADALARPFGRRRRALEAVVPVGLVVTAMCLQLYAQRDATSRAFDAFLTTLEPQYGDAPRPGSRRRPTPPTCSSRTPCRQAHQSP